VGEATCVSVLDLFGHNCCSRLPGTKQGSLQRLLGAAGRPRKGRMVTSRDVLPQGVSIEHQEVLAREKPCGCSACCWAQPAPASPKEQEEQRPNSRRGTRASTSAPSQASAMLSSARKKQGENQHRNVSKPSKQQSQSSSASNSHSAQGSSHGNATSGNGTSSSANTDGNRKKKTVTEEGAQMARAPQKASAGVSDAVPATKKGLSLQAPPRSLQPAQRQSSQPESQPGTTAAQSGHALEMVLRRAKPAALGGAGATGNASVTLAAAGRTAAVLDPSARPAEGPGPAQRRFSGRASPDSLLSAGGTHGKASAAKSLLVRARSLR